MAQRQKEKQKATTSAAVAAAMVPEGTSKSVPLEEEDVNSYTIVDKLEVVFQ